MFKGGTCNKIGLKEPPDELLVRGDHVILISLESDLPEVGNDTPLDYPLAFPSPTPINVHVGCL